jgi:hypothetical protein
MGIIEEEFFDFNKIKPPIERRVIPEIEKRGMRETFGVVCTTGVVFRPSFSS